MPVDVHDARYGQEQTMALNMIQETIFYGYPKLPFGVQGNGDVQCPVETCVVGTGTSDATIHAHRGSSLDQQMSTMMTRQHHLRVQAVQHDYFLLGLLQLWVFGDRKAKELLS